VGRKKFISSIFHNSGGKRSLKFNDNYRKKKHHFHVRGQYLFEERKLRTVIFFLFISHPHWVILGPDEKKTLLLIMQTSGAFLFSIKTVTTPARSILTEKSALSCSGNLSHSLPMNQSASTVRFMKQNPPTKQPSSGSGRVYVAVSRSRSSRLTANTA